MRVTYIFLFLILSGCGHSGQTTCHRPTRNFVEFFNNQNFRRIASLFQPGVLSGNQIRDLTDNLTYVYGVSGKIHSLEFIEGEGGRLLFKSIHENTTMDLSFRLNQRCQLLTYIIKTHYPHNLPILERNMTSLRLPFQGEWYVKWGGPELDQNYHNGHRNMQGAFDFIKNDSTGKSFGDQGEKNEDYYSFDQEVIAPCQATVVKVVDGIEDNKVGRINERKTYGNLLVLRTSSEEYLLLAHLKNHSIVVEEGQTVEQGDHLARSGNSGYSTEPHLHFIVQNVADLFHPTGAACYFDNILVDSVLMQDYSPVQGEVVCNVKQ